MILSKTKLTTASLVASRFNFAPMISLSSISEVILAISPNTAKRKARDNLLPFPVFRLSESQKAPWLILFDHLVEYVECLDAQSRFELFLPIYTQAVAVTFSQLTTTQLLMTKFQSDSCLPLIELTKEYLGLTASSAKRKARNDEFPFEVFRQSNSQKSPWFVSTESFVSYVEITATKSRKDWLRMQC
ncbi:pyocin activator PrtN family protein [Vibrio parahaemolyticus]|uniref:pyocin activator PrtN family protein n=1 Tax=Vibrio parahaemolyticus TaxID=670 RepID=UPI002879DBA8|nr:pyocin activator PrtN family protein [Vibrio parahaemolyticus]MDS1787016.1 pyocin activator PrtN family protein [Vibrio parahaemolyticus]